MTYHTVNINGNVLLPTLNVFPVEITLFLSATLWQKGLGALTQRGLWNPLDSALSFHRLSMHRFSICRFYNHAFNQPDIQCIEQDTLGNTVLDVSFVVKPTQTVFPMCSFGLQVLPNFYLPSYWPFRTTDT